jgi:hypothetical protein
MQQGIVYNILFLISQLQLFGGIGLMGYFSGMPMQALCEIFAAFYLIQLL